MNEVDLPLKGLLIDKGELLRPGAKLEAAAKHELTIIEQKKIALTKAWRACDQDLFSLTRYSRHRLIILRWNLRRKYHKKKHKDRSTHVYLYWDRPESVAEINQILQHEPDKNRVFDMMRVYEIARSNLDTRAVILRHIIRQAEMSSYGLLENVTSYHLAQAKNLINNL